MSAGVLREHGVACETTVPAALDGYRLTIRARANLVVDPDAVAYGGLALIKLVEIASLYQGLEDDYSLTYKPQAVETKTLEGDDHPAVCYLCPEMAPALADPAYIEEMVRCVVELGLPSGYTEHVRSFRL